MRTECERGQGVSRQETSRLHDSVGFKLMETLPLTNGKLDRQTLPQPDTKRPELKETYIAPRNEVERKLARHMDRRITDRRSRRPRQFFRSWRPFIECGPRSLPFA